MSSGGRIAGLGEKERIAEEDKRRNEEVSMCIHTYMCVQTYVNMSKHTHVYTRMSNSKLGMTAGLPSDRTGQKAQ